jgi:hypothetical protein
VITPRKCLPRNVEMALSVSTLAPAGPAVAHPAGSPDLAKIPFDLEF